MESTIVQNREKRRRHSRWDSPLEMTIDYRHSQTVDASNKDSRYSMNSKPSHRIEHQNHHDRQRIDYLKLSDDEFKYLLTSYPMKMNDTFSIYLQNIDICKPIRQYMSMLDKIVYLELEYDQWDTYYRIGFEKDIWSRKVSRKWAKLNTLVHCFGRSKDHINKKRQQIIDELVRRRNQLQLFERETLSILNIDMAIVSPIVLDCIRYRQRHLVRHYQWKQQLFLFDLEDYRLVQRFYDMNPNNDQSRCGQIVWRYTKEKMNLRTSLDLITYQLNHTCDITSTVDNRKSSLLMKTWMNEIRLDSVSMDHWRKIVGKTYVMLNSYLSYGQTLLKQIEEKIQREKDNLVNLSTTADANVSDEMLNIIEQREKNIFRRLICIHHEQLLSFFDRHSLNY